MVKMYYDKDADLEIFKGKRSRSSVTGVRGTPRPRICGTAALTLSSPNCRGLRITIWP